MTALLVALLLQPPTPTDLLQSAEQLIAEALRQMNPPPTCEPVAILPPANTDWIISATGKDPATFYFAGSPGAYWELPVLASCPVNATSNQSWLHIRGWRDPEPGAKSSPYTMLLILQADPNARSQRDAEIHVGSMGYQVQQEGR